MSKSKPKFPLSLPNSSLLSHQEKLTFLNILHPFEKSVNFIKFFQKLKIHIFRKLQNFQMSRHWTTLHLQ